MTTFQIRTKQGAAKAYRAILRQYMRDFDGGGMFGWDWPTMRLNAPEAYDTLQWLKRIYAGLPERRA